MRLESEEKALKKLKNRIMLLSRGIVLPDESIPIFHLQSVQGGPGPQGITCYVGDAPGSYSSQISVVIYPKEHYLAQYALPTKWWEEGESDNMGKGKKIVYTEDNIFLERVQSIWKGTLSNGRSASTLSKVRFHPYRTFSMGLYRTCRHLEQNEGCKFCTISTLMEKFNFPNRSSNQENLEYLKLAIANNPIRSVTLTSGTYESPERTGKDLLSLARQIREETGLSVHVQTEPIFDPVLLKELSEVADTIGIFLEMFDEKVRRQICPGKARESKPEDYMRSWEMAVSCFGRGKVWSTNIIGFDEDYEVMLQGIEKAAKIGVITSILLLRVGSPKLEQLIPSYIGREDEVLKMHMDLGKILVENAVDNISIKNSGCLGCQGCSATKEAVKWARIALGKNEGEE